MNLIFVKIYGQSLSQSSLLTWSEYFIENLISLVRFRPRDAAGDGEDNGNDDGEGGVDSDSENYGDDGDGVGDDNVNDKKKMVSVTLSICVSRIKIILFINTHFHTTKRTLVLCTSHRQV